MEDTLFSLDLCSEADVVVARQVARQLAAQLGFASLEQTHIATAVSELARSTLQDGGGRLEFLLQKERRQQALLVSISGRMPEEAKREDASAASPAVPGIGQEAVITGRRLMDHVRIEAPPGRAPTILMTKYLPATAPAAAAERLTQLADEVAGRPQSLAEEFRQQNQELLRVQQELLQRQEELLQLSHELEDTNRGVLALYAELDERAVRLRHADELKSRFLSHMSHEFRTPLNAINALTYLLLGRSDGELTTEQEKQVTYIRRASMNLLEMVNDLLDLAKVEAGKLALRPQMFTLLDLFRALRGMMRPLHTNPDVTLIIEEPHDELPLYTDESKVSQILHNLVSNALKFTERGSVRVSAARTDDGQAIIFSVADTGIGIAPENQERIFQEFGQLEHPIQQRVKGTGLGLSLSRRLAELLGGTLTVESQVGVGSTFRARIPCRYRPAAESAGAPAEPLAAMEVPARVLLIDDEEVSRYLFHTYLSDSGHTLIETSGGIEGVAEARRLPPDIIFLDLVMPDMNGFQVLDELQRSPTTRAIPVIVLTSKQLTGVERHHLEGKVAAILSKETVTRERVLEQIGQVLQAHPNEDIAGRGAGLTLPVAGSDND